MEDRIKSCFVFIFELNVTGVNKTRMHLSSELCAGREMKRLSVFAAMGSMATVGESSSADCLLNFHFPVDLFTCVSFYGPLPVIVDVPSRALEFVILMTQQITL